MSLFSALKKRIEGVVAQVNPFDNGATYNTVLQNRPVAPAPRVVQSPQNLGFGSFGNQGSQFGIQPRPQVNNPSGIDNIFNALSHTATGLEQGLRHGAGGLLGSTIVNPAKELAAQVTHNPAAQRNAQIAGNRSSQDFLNVTQPILRTIPEVATTLSHPARQFTYNPNSSVEQMLFGSTPVQNIQKKVATTYTRNQGKPLPVRIGLAAGEGLLSVAQDLPVGGAAIRVSKTARPLANEFRTANEFGAVGKNVNKPNKFQKPIQPAGKNPQSQPINSQPLKPQLNLGVDLTPPNVAPKATAARLEKPKLPSAPEPIRVAPSGATIPQKQLTVQDLNRNISGGRIKQQSLPQSFAGADNIEQSIKESIGAFGGQYTQKANKDLWNAAQYRVTKNFDDAVNFFRTANNDESVATGYAIAQKLYQNGKNVEANRILSEMADRAVEHGRSAQAYAIMKRMSPEGIVLHAEKQVKRFLEKNPEKLGKLNWNDNVRQELYNMAEQLKALPEGRDRNLLIGRMQDTIDQIFPTSVADKAVTVWKAGLLTALRTHERNILSNTLNLGAELASDTVGSLIDRLLSLRTGQRTLVATPRGLGKGGREGVQVAKDLAKTGIDVTGDRLKHNINRVTWGNNKFEQALKGYTETVFRTLAAEDKVPRFSREYNKLYNQAIAAAKTKGLRGGEKEKFIQDFVMNPTRQAQEIAQESGARAVFGHDTALGKAISEGKRGIKVKSKAAGTVADILMPFTQVPAGVGSQLISYSPFGFTKSVYQIGKVLVTGDKQLQLQAAERFGRGAVGTAILGAGALLMSKGLMTGKPKDQKEAARWEAEGKPSNAIKVGDRWFGLGSIGPQTILLVAAGQALEDSQNGESKVNLVASIGQNYKDQTFLKGMSSALDAVGDPSRYAANFIQMQASSVVPNIVKDAARSADPYKRQVNGVTDALKNSIPGLRNSLPVNYDILGNPVQNPNGGAGAFLDLFNSSRPNSSQNIKVLNQLGATDTPANPAQIPKTVTISGESTRLNSQQISGLQRYTGTRFNDVVTKLQKDLNFLAASDADKSKILNNAYSDIFSAGKIQMLNDNPKNVSDNTKRILEGKTIAYANVSPKLDKQYVDTLNRFALMSNEDKAKTFNTEKDAEYKYDLAQYQNDLAEGKLSRVQKINAQQKLARAKVGASFSKDTRDIYNNLSRAEIETLITSDPDGKKIASDLLAYDNALVKAGIIKKGKFAYGFGSKGSGGRGKSFKASAIKIAKIDKSSAVQIAKPSGQLEKKPGIKVAKVKKVKMSAPKIKGAIG